jgi:hypothetical protein
MRHERGSPATLATFSLKMVQDGIAAIAPHDTGHPGHIASA